MNSGKGFQGFMLAAKWLIMMQKSKFINTMLIHCVIMFIGWSLFLFASSLFLSNTVLLEETFIQNVTEEFYFIPLLIYITWFLLGSLFMMPSSFAVYKLRGTRFRLQMMPVSIPNKYMAAWVVGILSYSFIFVFSFWVADTLRYLLFAIGGVKFNPSLYTEVIPMAMGLIYKYMMSLNVYMLGTNSILVTLFSVLHILLNYLPDLCVVVCVVCYARRRMLLWGVIAVASLGFVRSIILFSTGLLITGDSISFFLTDGFYLLEMIVTVALSYYFFKNRALKG